MKENSALNSRMQLQIHIEANQSNALMTSINVVIQMALCQACRRIKSVFSCRVPANTMETATRSGKYQNKYWGDIEIDIKG
jgi:hypothetical protein